MACRVSTAAAAASTSPIDSRRKRWRFSTQRRRALLSRPLALRGAHADRGSADRVREWRSGCPRCRTASPSRRVRCAPAYAAMLESVDQSVGRIIAKLEELGIARETLVVVTSDNGRVEETPDTGQVITPQRAAARRQGDSLRGGLARAAPGALAGGGRGGTRDRRLDRHHGLVPDAARRRRRRRRRAPDGDLARRRQPRCRCCARPTRASSVRSTSTTRTTSPATATTRLARPGGTRRARRSAPAPSSSFVASTAPRALRPGDAIPAKRSDLAADRPPTCGATRGDLERWLEVEGAHLPRPTPPTTPAPSHVVSPIRWRLWALVGVDAQRRLRPSASTGGKLELDCVETRSSSGPSWWPTGPLRVAVRFTLHGTRGGPRSGTAPRRSPSSTAIASLSTPRPSRASSRPDRARRDPAPAQDRLRPQQGGGSRSTGSVSTTPRTTPRRSCSGASTPPRRPLVPRPEDHPISR